MRESEEYIKLKKQIDDVIERAVYDGCYYEDVINAREEILAYVHEWVDSFEGGVI